MSSDAPRSADADGDSALLPANPPGIPAFAPSPQSAPSTKPSHEHDTSQQDRAQGQSTDPAADVRPPTSSPCEPPPPPPPARKKRPAMRALKVTVTEEQVRRSCGCEFDPRYGDAHRQTSGPGKSDGGRDEGDGGGGRSDASEGGPLLGRADSASAPKGGRDREKLRAALRAKLRGKACVRTGEAMRVLKESEGAEIDKVAKRAKRGRSADVVKDVLDSAGVQDKRVRDYVGQLINNGRPTADFGEMAMRMKERNRKGGRGRGSDGSNNEHECETECEGDRRDDGNGRRSSGPAHERKGGGGSDGGRAGGGGGGGGRGRGGNASGSKSLGRNK